MYNCNFVECSFNSEVLNLLHNMQQWRRRGRKKNKEKSYGHTNVPQRKKNNYYNELTWALHFAVLSMCMHVDDAGIQMRNVDGWNWYGKFQFHSKRRKIKTISSWLWMWGKSYKRVAQKKELTKYKKTVGWPCKNKKKTIISYWSCCIFLVLGSTFTLNWI